ncbi:hypothetical protein OHA53_11040 [Streptomyces althioticus]|uniref:hypothetical protein n=1 Tax=Streptomyces althioticus TaxID=83380 RepID=UPI0038731C90|nr:hypothetical protein OHA53_11040 [Streptomyces althioticus]
MRGIQVGNVIGSAQRAWPDMVNVDFIVLAEVAGTDMAVENALFFPVVSEAKLAHQPAVSIPARLAVSTPLVTLISGRALAVKVAPDQLLTTSAGSRRQTALGQMSVANVQRPARVLCSEAALKVARLGVSLGAVFRVIRQAFAFLGIFRRTHSRITQARCNYRTGAR